MLNVVSMLKFVLTATLVLAFLPLCAKAADKQDFVNWLQHFDSINAQFKQVLKDEANFIEEHSSGRVAISRPGKFRWDYIEPEEKLVLADSAKLYVWEKDLEQVSIYRQSDIMEDLPLSWLTHKTDLAAEFILNVGEFVRGTQFFSLVPKKGNQIDRIEVGLKVGNLSQINLFDANGQVTYIRFINPRMNDKLPESLFEMNLPKDADILGES